MDGRLRSRREGFFYFSSLALEGRVGAFDFACLVMILAYNPRTLLETDQTFNHE